MDVLIAYHGMARGSPCVVPFWDKTSSLPQVNNLEGLLYVLMITNDRTKLGGGVLAHLSSRLPSKKLKLPRTFTTLEALVIESKFGKHDVVIMGLYRPPKAAGMDY